MLSTTSEHAIRALVFLAKIPDGESILGRDLSAIAEVPSNYLAKILIQLNRQGMLEATRGRGGGYRLSRPAEEIKLIEIVTALEGEAAIPQCILEHGRICSDEKPCAAHQDWRKVRNSYVRFLEETTIARISNNIGENEVAKLREHADRLQAMRAKASGVPEVIPLVDELVAQLARRAQASARERAMLAAGVAQSWREAARQRQIAANLREALSQSLPRQVYRRYLSRPLRALGLEPLLRRLLGRPRSPQ